MTGKERRSLNFVVRCGGHRMHDKVHSKKTKGFGAVRQNCANFQNWNAYYRLFCISIIYVIIYPIVEGSRPSFAEKVKTSITNSKKLAFNSMERYHTCSEKQKMSCFVSRILPGGGNKIRFDEIAVRVGSFSTCGVFVPHVYGAKLPSFLRKQYQQETLMIGWLGGRSTQRSDGSSHLILSDGLFFP